MQPDRNPQEPPLTARSIVASTLLGLRPPALPPAALVRAGEIFGIAEGTTRVALSRMLAAGELESEDGVYRLAGRLLDRHGATGREPSSAAQTLGRRVAPGRRHRARAARAAERADLRHAMRELRFAEVREGVWMRPDNLAGTTLRARARDRGRAVHVDDARPSTIRARSPRELWDLDGWARHAQTLRRRMRTSLHRARRTRLPLRCARGSSSRPPSCGTCRPTR